jgi:hypothetical protein
LEEERVAVESGRHLVQCRDGLGREAGEEAKPAFCAVVRADFLRRLRELNVPDEVWIEDRDKLRRWVNQNKKSPHWSKKPMNLAELRQHMEFLDQAMADAEERGRGRS